MREALFLFLYGVPAFVGAGLAAFWGAIGLKRWNEIKRHHPWWCDRYFLVVVGFALVSLGAAILYATRVYGNLHYGLSPILYGTEGYVMIAGLIVVTLGFFVMVWLADLEIHPPRWTWVRRTIILSAIWAVTVVVLTLTAGV